MSEVVPVGDVEDVFTDTCVVVLYAVEERQRQRKFFEDSARTGSHERIDA